MAPEFNFIVSTEDNALVENVKARASANRQALGNRQELKKAETAVNTQATKNEAATRTGATRLTKEQTYEELTATRKGGLKVLNLVMGNGPAHIDDVGGYVNYPTSFNDGIGPFNNLTYEVIRENYAKAVQFASAELQAVYGNKTTNVYLHIIGSHFVDAHIVQGPLPILYNIEASLAVTDALPEAVGSYANIQKITMQANVTDVVGHLRSNGIDIITYDCIFIQSDYCVATAEGDRSGQAPIRLVYRYGYRSLMDPVIFTAPNYFGPRTYDENSAPLKNLLAQLDSPTTYAFDDEVHDPATMPNSIIREYNTTNVADTMQKIKTRGSRLVSINDPSTYGYLTQDDNLSGTIQLGYPGNVGLKGYTFFYVYRANTPVVASPAFTWNEVMPLASINRRRVPFFGTLLRRLRYPLRRLEVLAPTQTYQSGSASSITTGMPLGNMAFYKPTNFAGVVVNPPTENYEDLSSALIDSYGIYLINSVTQDSTSAGSFLQANTYAHTVKAQLDPSYYYFQTDPENVFWYPYYVFEVTDSMRALYSAAMSKRDLRKA